MNHRTLAQPVELGKIDASIQKLHSETSPASLQADVEGYLLEDVFSNRWLPFSFGKGVDSF